MAELLAVDDDPQFLTVLAKHLVRAGHAVRCAANGGEALAAYRSRPADAVVLDIIMPETEGTETILALLRLDPGARILAISGGGLIDASLCLDLAEKLGARRTLRKPFTHDELLQALTSVLEAD